jgi:hypothetical protein
VVLLTRSISVQRLNTNIYIFYFSFFHNFNPVIYKWRNGKLLLMSDSVTPYKCKECGDIAFPTREEYEEHNRQEHGK